MLNGDCCSHRLHNKSLKIPKEQSEVVNRRRTDNTMAKRKWEKNKQWSTKYDTGNQW